MKQSSLYKYVQLSQINESITIAILRKISLVLFKKIKQIRFKFKYKKELLSIDIQHKDLLIDRLKALNLDITKYEKDLKTPEGRNKLFIFIDQLEDKVYFKQFEELITILSKENKLTERNKVVNLLHLCKTSENGIYSMDYNDYVWIFDLYHEIIISK